MFVKIFLFFVSMFLLGMVGFFAIHFRNIYAIINREKETISGSIPFYAVFGLISMMGMVGGVVTLVLRFFEYLK